MPDQLPSAIVDSTNSFDSLFALDIDTRQRFDNILNNQQKPIDYPLPDYDKEMTPKGLPQDELLNPNKMRGTLGEAMFSPDPKIADYAVSKIRAGQSNLPVNRGIGVPDRFAYDKAMDKFLSGDYGYNPYQSIEDNEDFNYRYDYMSQSLAERIFKNTGVGISRFVGSVVLKLGQTLGYMGSMIGNGIEEIFNSKDNNFMADVADNSMSRWFEGLEEDMKNSNTLSVFKPKGWEDMGFFQKMGNGAFWTDEFADGAAFMGEMVASMYLLGGLGRIGSVGRFGATEINLAKSMGKLGSLGRYTGTTLDYALKTATGAENLSGIGRWAFSVASESAFEASGLYKQRKEELKSDRTAGRNAYSDEEIESIAGDSAAASFKANMLVLSASNAFENKFIFSPLFKRMRVNKPDPRGRLISINQGTGSLDELAQAAHKEHKYTTWLGKKLDWKNSNSRLRFYGSRGLSSTAAEGFWEENAQLAIERLAGADNLSLSTFAKKLKDQTIGALTGDDPEAQTSIGLGALIGIGGTGIVSKVSGGDRLFQGERQKREADTFSAVTIYENARRNFLNFQDIYVRDPQTQKPILDENGNLQIDEVKAAGILDGIAAFTSKQEAAATVNDPRLRKYLQDSAMADYVSAAKNAGIFNRASHRLSTLGDLTQTQLENLGFDPSTTVDTVYLKDSLKEFGKIYDKVQNSPSARLGKNDKIEDELSRKHALYKASTNVYSSNKLMGEYQSAMLDRDFPSVFSPEAEGNTSEIQAYNSLIFQKEALEQWSELAKENGDFYNDLIKNETRRINSDLSRLDGLLNSMEEIGDLKLEKTPRGFLISTDKYAGLSPKVKDINMDIEFGDQRKHAQMANEVAKNKYLVSKFASLQDGISNYKNYMDYVNSIQKKDAKADGVSVEQTPSPVETVTPPSPIVQTPTPPVKVETAPTSPAPVTKKEAVKSVDVITAFVPMLSQGLAAETAQNPDTLPDYKALAAYIDENVVRNRVAIEDAIVDLMRETGRIILGQIRTNTFNSDPSVNTSLENFTNQSIFIDKLMNEVEDEDLRNDVLEYMETINDAIDTYAPVEVTLTEAEQNALQVLSTLDLTNSPLAPYAAILNNPDSSNQDKREALRYISDQLLAPSTAETVGTTLGRIGSEAIENLEYEAPQESEELQGPPPIEQPTTEGTPEPVIFQPELKVGDRVVVNTKKDGVSTIKEIRGDKALLEDGRQVLLSKLILDEPSLPLTPPVPPIETQAEEASDNTEGSGIQEEVPPPEPPLPPENSDEQSVVQENWIDITVDNSKKLSLFTFPQNMPEEVVMEGNQAKIVNGAIQLKTASDPLLLRQHNILKKMGEKTNPVNFWSQDGDGNPLYKVRLEQAGFKNAAKYTPWVYDTGKGLINQKTGKPNAFPFVVAMVVDQQGNYVYFDEEGNVTSKAKGKPFGFPYTVEDYTSINLDISRKGVQLGTREPLNGTHGYLNNNPLEDLSTAIRAGVQLLGTIDDVTSGKLSTYNVDNQGSTWAKTPQQRTVKQLEEDGDITDSAVMVLRSSTMTGFELSSETTPGSPTQKIKVGQPYLFDEKSGMKIPLRGKKLKDLTLDGKPFITGQLKTTIEDLSKDGEVFLPQDAATPENIALMENLFNTLRALVYSRNTPIFINEAKTYISILDQRTDNIPLMETEINYSTGISIFSNPFETESEGFNYENFIKENFLTGAVPAQLTKDHKGFEKLNRRVIFTLEKDHQQILDSIGAKADPTKTLRMKMTDHTKFINKTYRRRGSTSSITVTGYSDGKFSITGPFGPTTQSTEDFLRDIKGMEEVTLPAPTEEVTDEMAKDIKLSKEKIDEIRERSKGMTAEDENSLDFGC